MHVYCRSFDRRMTSCLLASRFVILDKPVHRFLDSFLNRGELVIGQVFTKLVVGGRLFKLSIRFGGIEFDFSLKLHGFGYGQGDILNADFILFVDGKCNGRRIIVVRTQGPDSEFGQVTVVNELTQGCSTAPDFKGSTVLFRQVTLVHQAWDDVSALNREVVERSVNVLEECQWRKGEISLQK